MLESTLLFSLCFFFLLQCHVRKFSKNGLSVTISKGIVGFIPNVHLADVTLRHPEKQFSEGNKLKCRVSRLHFR